MKYIYLFGLALSIVPISVMADTVMRSGAAISVANDQVVEGNFYGWGNTVSLTGEMAGDVMVAGGNVTIGGTVAHDVAVVGGTVLISGDVKDDVRAIGGDVTITGTIRGSLTVAAGRVKILPTAQIEGDLVVYANDVIVDGNVGGGVMGSINLLRLNAEVGKGVSVRVQSLTLGERAVIAGDVQYESPSELVRSPNATISGVVTKRELTPVSSQEVLRVMAMWALMVLFGTLALYLMARRQVLTLCAVTTVVPVWKLVLLGLATALVTPILVVVLLSSVLGVLAGLLLLLLFMVLTIIALFMMAVLFGLTVAQALKQPTETYTLLWIVAGATSLAILALVPLLGLILLMVVWCWTLGTLVWWGSARLFDPATE